jgi:hypothetical protein
MTAFGRRSFSATRARAENGLSAPIDDDGPTIAVAGPPGSDAAWWANILHGPLAARFRPPRTLRLSYLGGRDGVTGTNMFDARALPDGQAALLFPGGAALAWLVGDSRVRFDAARLLPMLAAVSSGVLCVRQGDRTLAGGTVRLGCTGTVAPSLTILMAMDMLGAKVRPVMASPDCLQAARRGEVDAVFARGVEMQAQLHALADAGLPPVYAVSFPHPDLAAPSFRGLPDLGAALAGHDTRLMDAWHAVAAASLLDAVLALPRLCPDASLGHWRDACERARASPDIADRVPQNIRLLSGEQSDAAFATVMAQTPVQQTLHAWMAARLNWRPT